MLLDSIESRVIHLVDNPSYDCIIWDGMVILQQLASIQLTTFGDVAELVFKRVLTKKVVYFVTDQYKPGSIKYLELEKRKALNGPMRVWIEKREQKRPKQRKKYLRDDQNKSEPAKFLLEDWSHPTRYAHLFPSATILFFNSGSQFFFLSGISFTNIHESQDCRRRGRAFS